MKTPSDPLRIEEEISIRNFIHTLIEFTLGEGKNGRKKNKFGTSYEDSLIG